MKFKKKPLTSKMLPMTKEMSSESWSETNLKLSKSVSGPIKSRTFKLLSLNLKSQSSWKISKRKSLSSWTSLFSPVWSKLMMTRPSSPNSTISYHPLKKNHNQEQSRSWSNFMRMNHPTQKSELCGTFFITQCLHSENPWKQSNLQTLWRL